MKLKGHIISSIPLGAGCYLLSGDLVISVSSMTSTIAIDFDHYIDYLITQKRISSIKEIINAFKTLSVVKKNYFFLHSWELIIIIAIGLFHCPNPLLIALYAGYLLHIILDQINNTYFLGRYNLKLLFYFFCYRMSYNFDVLPLRKHILSLEEQIKIF